MKIFYTYLTAVFIVVTAHFASAQTQTIKYYSKSGRVEVPASEAHYFEVEETNETWGGTRTRYLKEDSTKVSVFNYSNFNGGLHGLGVKQGPHYEWYKNGKLKTESNYIKNELSGAYKEWYESGQLHYIKHYKEYKLQDTLTAYYETGKLRRIEVYTDNKLVTGKVFDEEGKELKFFPMEKMPEFPGGELQLQHYLARNIRYPKAAQRSGASGMVVVTFVVSKDGAIGDIEVIRSVDKDLDAEAVRVLATMPSWKPGSFEGKPVAVAFSVPVRFSISK